MKETILADFKKNEHTYNSYKDKITQLLSDLLVAQNKRIHQINGRTKTLESLSKKIDEKSEKYKSIDDITDIIGVRIISYLESEVDSIAELIEEEFIKDSINSIDKRKLKSDQFGYKSLHIVISLNDDRYKLNEYKQYKDIKCEIQIRSILQHAWAEIEHDLGYKGEISIPEPYKRTFNRLSALLETADIEFDRLQKELIEYEKAIPQLIESESESVDINKASLSSFLKTNKILLEAQEIAEETSGLKSKQVNIPDSTINRTNYLNFKTIADIEKSLIQKRSQYLKFIKIVVSSYEATRAPLSTTSIILFLDFLILETQNISEIDNYYKTIGLNNIDTAGYKQRIELYKKTLE